MAGDEGESSTDEGPTQNCVWCFDKRLREGKDMSQSGQQISMIYSSFNTTSTLCSTRNRIHYTPKKTGLHCWYQITLLSDRGTQV